MNPEDWLPEFVRNADLGPRPPADQEEGEVVEEAANAGTCSFAQRFARRRPMTKYESSVVIADRAVALGAGAPILAVPTTQGKCINPYAPLNIATAELAANALTDITIIRPLPDASTVEVGIKDILPRRRRDKLW